MISFDQVMNKALEVTEMFVVHHQKQHHLSAKHAMHLRQFAYPLVSQYLTEDVFSASAQVLDTLLPSFLTSTQTQGVLVQANQSYCFGQKDINDGLGQYAKTEEFQELVQTIKWGTKWQGQMHIDREPNPDHLRQELYKAVVHFLSGGVRASTNWIGTSEEQSKANNAVVTYHAKRIKQLLMNQPDAFIIQKNDNSDQEEPAKNEPTQKNAEPLPQAEQGSLSVETTMPAVVKNIQDEWLKLLEQARAYRQTVSTTERMLMQTVTVGESVDLEPMDRSWLLEQKEKPEMKTGKRKPQ